MPQVLYFEVWDADSRAPTGEIIDGDNTEVCFPSSSKANIEAVSTECTRRVLLELTRPDGSTFNRNEGKEPFLVFGDRLLDNPPTVNGRFFKDNGAYSISAYPKSDPTAVLTYNFNVKLCETPTDPPTKSPTQPPSTSPPTKSPVSKPPSSGNDDCTPSQRTCASTQEELQAFLDASNPYEIVGICDGATIDTSTAPITMAQDYLTMCCAGSNCILENNGSGRNLVVNGAATSIIGIEFVGGVAKHDWGGNVNWWFAEGENNIIDCIFRDGMADGAGHLHVAFGWEPEPEATITIEKSTFVGGKASSDGGAIYITDAHDIFIRDCNFTANAAGTVWDSAIGGAIAISSEVGHMPKLEILNTVFSDNINGAVGVMLNGALADYDITFSGNSVGGNTPPSTSDCTHFYEPWTDTCIPLSEESP